MDEEQCIIQMEINMRETFGMMQYMDLGNCGILIKKRSKRLRESLMLKF